MKLSWQIEDDDIKKVKLFFMMLKKTIRLF
jgi:hypothetical protein